MVCIPSSMSGPPSKRRRVSRELRWEVELFAPFSSFAPSYLQLLTSNPLTYRSMSTTLFLERRRLPGFAGLTITRFVLPNSLVS